MLAATDLASWVRWSATAVISSGDGSMLDDSRWCVARIGSLWPGGRSLRALERLVGRRQQQNRSDSLLRQDLNQRRHCHWLVMRSGRHACSSVFAQRHAGREGEAVTTMREGAMRWTRRLHHYFFACKTLAWMHGERWQFKHELWPLIWPLHG